MSAVLVWHPGASISTADVSAGLCAGLAAEGVEVIEYRHDVQLLLQKRVTRWLWQDAGRPAEKPTAADVQYRASKEILADACRARRLAGVEWVIVVSGMFQHQDLFVYLRDAGFKLAILLTESPYDLEHELAAIDQRDKTGAPEPVANLVFTHERTCVETFRAVQPRTVYLPHAWNPAVVEHARPPARAAHDVVFVGTYFEERRDWLTAVDWTGIDLGLYGGTEQIGRTRGRSTALRPHVAGAYCSNAETAALYQAARVGINLHRTSKGFGTGAHVRTAESLNPRDYELAALGCFYLSDPRAELAERLPMIPTVETPAAARPVIDRALADPGWRAGIATAARDAVAGDTWTARAGTVCAALWGSAP